MTLSANLECMSEMCCMRLDQNTGCKKLPSGHHCTTSLGHIFASKACIDNQKHLLNSNISFTCPRNMVNFGPLTAEICWRVWGTPANFNRFHVLASLLHRRHSMEVNKTLQDIWLSLCWYTIYTFFGALAPKWNFASCKVNFGTSVLLYW